MNSIGRTPRSKVTKTNADDKRKVQNRMAQRALRERRKAQEDGLQAKVDKLSKDQEALLIEKNSLELELLWLRAALGEIVASQAGATESPLLTPPYMSDAEYQKMFEDCIDVEAGEAARLKEKTTQEI